MLASALLAGIAVGLGTGGSWRRLAEIRIRWWPLLVAAFVLRLVAATPVSVDVARVLYVGSLWILVAVSVRNLLLVGAPLIAAGIAANALIITLSGGVMPVSTDALALAGGREPDVVFHRLTPSPSPLGDILPVPLLGVYSLGDVLLAVGVFILLVRTMRPSR